MGARRFYAMAGDMKDFQEYYCAQSIFGEFVYSYEYDEQAKVIADLRAVNAELLEALEELIKASPRQYDAALTNVWSAIARARD